jgi:hypothetical protein
MSGRCGMSAAEKVLLEVGKRVFGNKPGKTQPLIKVLREECFIADEEDDDKDDLNFLLKYTNDGTIGKELKDLGFPRTFVRELEEKLRELGLQVVPYKDGDQVRADTNAARDIQASTPAARKVEANTNAAGEATIGSRSRERSRSLPPLLSLENEVEEESKAEPEDEVEATAEATAEAIAEAIAEATAEATAEAEFMPQQELESLVRAVVVEGQNTRAKRCNEDDNRRVSKFQRVDDLSQADIRNGAVEAAAAGSTQKQKMEQERNGHIKRWSSKVFFSRVPTDDWVNEDYVKGIFASQVGHHNVKNVKILWNSTNPYGFAYFTNPNSAKRCLEIPIEVDGVRLEVKQSAVIRVGKLEPQITDQAFRAHFTKFGTISDLKIKDIPSKGRFANLSFRSMEDTATVLQLGKETMDDGTILQITDPDEDIANGAQLTPASNVLPQGPQSVYDSGVRSGNSDKGGKGFRGDRCNMAKGGAEIWYGNRVLGNQRTPCRYWCGPDAWCPWGSSCRFSHPNTWN